MKNILTLMMAFMLFFNSNLQSQNIVKREIASFNKVNAYGDISVYMTKGKTESIEIEIPDNIAPDKITTLVENNELKIKSYSGLLENKKKIKIYLTYRELIGITSGGSAAIDIPDSVITGEKMTLTAFTGGTIDVTVDVQQVFVEVSEKSVVVVSGYTTKVDIIASTNGVFSGYELEAEDATVKALTNGIVKVNTTMSLNANASTGGWVGYMNDPKYKFFTPKLGGKIEKVEGE